MKKKKFSYFLLAVFSVFTLVRTYYFLTDDFYLGNIQNHSSFRKEWAVPPPSITTQEQEKIFSQTYHYLGKGAQCYAFESEDGDYIFKFFKFKHLRPRPFYRFFPDFGFFSSLKENEKLRKEVRLENVFTGYKLAYTDYQDLSKVVLLQLNGKKGINRILTVTDKMGRIQRVDLAKTPFLVQRKGKILRTVIREFLEQGKVEKAKEALRKITYMYLSEYEKGVYDRDHGVMHNTGFIQEEPFHLDVGKFCEREEMKNPQIFSDDLEFVIWKIDLWLKNNFPKERKELIEAMADVFVLSAGRDLALEKVDPNKFIRKKRKVSLT